MRSRPFRFILIGSLSLSLCLSFLIPTAAEAKKHGARAIVLGKPTPTGIPFANSGTGQFGVARIPLTAGKRAKGKLVGGLSATTSFSGSAGFGGAVATRITAPNGLTLGLASPADDPVATNIGPTTETPNSPFGFCIPNYPPAAAPPPPCADPDNVLGPPYAGTVENPFLLWFRGIKARGTWTVTVLNTSNAHAVTLNSLRLVIGLTRR